MEQPHTIEGSKAPGSATSGQVLFVDDDPLVRRTVGRFLKRARVPCRLAAGGEEALEAIDEDPNAFGVVLADYQMPGIDGVAFLREVAFTTPWATRILVSGQLSLDEALQAVNSGAIFQIITKPVAAEDLLTLVRKAQDRANLAHRNAQLLDELHQKNTALAAINDRLDQLLMERTNALLNVWAATMDLRIGPDRGRSGRLARYARRLGEQLGLGDRELAAVEHGALLQGIATVSAPDDLVRPSAPLSASDRALLHEHRCRGADILEYVDFLTDAAAIVRHEVDRFDGASTAMGLSGRDIPVGARILQLVQVLDNLTRPEDKRPSRGWAWAREEIRRQAGGALDPDVVAAYEQVSDQEWSVLRVDHSRMSR